MRNSIEFQRAMFEVPDASVTSGTVVQVVQTGFMIGDRHRWRSCGVTGATPGATWHAVATSNTALVSALIRSDRSSSANGTAFRDRYPPAKALRALINRVQIMLIVRSPHFRIVPKGRD